MPIMMPGGYTSHGPLVKCWLAAVSMFPHDGTGGWMPKPR